MALSIAAGAVTGFFAIILCIIIFRFFWRLIKSRLRAARAAGAEFSPEESPPARRAAASPELAPVSLPVSQAVLAEFMEAGVFSSPPAQPPRRSLLCGAPPSLGQQGGNTVTALQVLSGAAKE